MTRRAAILPIFLLAVLVLADRSEVLPVGEDSYVTAAAPLASYGSAETLSVASGGLGWCAPSEVSYLRFDLSGLKEGPVSDAALLLDVTYAASSNSGLLALYAAPDNVAGGTSPWWEATLTWSNRPGLEGMARLASATVPTRGGPVRFRDQALAAFVNQEASFGGARPGDDTLSLALLIEGCTGLNSVVRFASSEHSSAAGPALTFWPPLKTFMPVLH